MTDKQVDAASSLESGQSVDRIRDIIFGSQMRDYEQRFQVFKRDLDRLQQELDNLAEQLTDQDNSNNRKLQTLRREMRQSDDDLRNELREASQRLTTDKVDHIALGELFVELGNNIKSGDSLVGLLQSLDDNDTQ